MNQELISKKKDLVEFFLNNGILLSNDLLLKLEKDIETENLKELLKKINSTNLLILNRDVASLLLDVYKPIDINWLELEQSRAFSEKGKESTYKNFIEFMSKQKEIASDDKYPVKVLSSYNTNLKKWTADDFIEHLNSRFISLEKLLRKRQELTNLISINKLINKREKEEVSLIGMVQKKEFTKNNNLILTVEDPTGHIKVVINRNKPNLFEESLSIVLDEVIAVQGVISNGVVFTNNILWPDIPINKELKKSNDECYAIFLSDLHIGSKYFLENDFMKFIRWINLEIGDEQQAKIAEKVGYIFVLGDVVDGAGIYPSQEDDLLIKDVKQQYAECSRLFSMIPKHIKIIMCTGNHDAMRLTEPQLPIHREFAEGLYKLPNLILVSNPVLVNIHAKDGFSGFDVLIYHGYSFDYYVANVDFIRNNGGYDRVDLIMKFLLRRRHLAPTHSSNLYIPEKNDPLVIETIPDIFATGHIHKASITNYKGITLISGSCWQSLTAYQERHGHKPEPCRVPIVNLQRRDAKIMRFCK